MTRPTGTNEANDFTAVSSVSIARDRTATSRIGDSSGGRFSPSRSWILVTFSASFSSGAEMTLDRK